MVGRLEQDRGRVALDRPEGGAQLVGDGREELVLEPAELLVRGDVAQHLDGALDGAVLPVNRGAGDRHRRPAAVVPGQPPLDDADRRPIRDGEQPAAGAATALALCGQAHDLAIRLAEHLVGRPAGQSLGGRVEGGDPPVRVGRHDRVGHRFDDRPVAALLERQRLARLPEALAHVVERPGQEPHLAAAEAAYRRGQVASGDAAGGGDQRLDRRDDRAPGHPGEEERRRERQHADPEGLPAPPVGRRVEGRLGAPQAETPGRAGQRRERHHVSLAVLLDRIGQGEGAGGPREQPVVEGWMIGRVEGPTGVAVLSADDQVQILVDQLGMAVLAEQVGGLSDRLEASGGHVEPAGQRAHDLAVGGAHRDSQDGGRAPGRLLSLDWRDVARSGRERLADVVGGRQVIAGPGRVGRSRPLDTSDRVGQEEAADEGVAAARVIDQQSLL